MRYGTVRLGYGTVKVQYAWGRVRYGTAEVGYNWGTFSHTPLEPLLNQLGTHGWASSVVHANWPW